MKRKIMAFLMSIVTLFTANSCGIKQNNNSKTNDTENNIIDEEIEKEVEIEIIEDTISEKTNIDEKQVEKKTITISAVGDCTLGRDDRSDYYNSLPHFLEKNNYDYSYFFKGVYDIVSNDDLTIANLESVFTDYNVRADKKFTFKATSDFVNILLEGSVEAVNLANNHTYDYLQKGYDDTILTLKNNFVEYFGNGIYNIVEVKGKKIGLCGIQGWDTYYACNCIDDAMKYFNEVGTDLEIFSFHWGEERDYTQNENQETIARHAIDSGADLVLGHHPHVLQGIEEYNGKYIVYSLGNFVFGGNKNPGDKDTMVVQVSFNYENDKLIGTDIKLIPTLLSSVDDYNDYQPTILEGERKEKVLKKVLDASKNYEYIEK